VTELFQPTTKGFTHLVHRHDWGSDEPITYLSTARDIKVALTQIQTDADLIDDTDEVVKQVLDAIHNPDYYIEAGATHQYPIEATPGTDPIWYITSVWDCDQTH